MSITSRRECLSMARWPDNTRSVTITVLLIFLVAPLLFWLTWWFVKG